MSMGEKKTLPFAVVCLDTFPQEDNLWVPVAVKP